MNEQRMTGEIYGQIASGQESDMIDLAGFVLAGLISTASMAAGTLTFLAAPTANDTFQPIKTASGADFTLGPYSGTFALKGDDLACLAPYRFIKVKSSVNQTDWTFVMPVKV